MRVNFAVLDPGEPVDSERIVNEYGPAIMTAMHSVVDRHLEYGEDPPEFLRPIWKDYLGFNMARPEAERQCRQPGQQPEHLRPEQPARQQPEQAAWRQWRPAEWQRVRCWRLPASRRPSASAPQRVR